MELLEPFWLPLHPLKLFPQLIEKQRLDQLEDIGLADVVDTQISAVRSIHNRLEQRAENCWRNPAPIQRRAIE